MDNAKPCSTCGTHHNHPDLHDAEGYYANQYSQPDPAGQTFDDGLYGALQGQVTYYANGKEYIADFGTMMSVESYQALYNRVLAAHNADREAYARQEVVKALEGLFDNAHWYMSDPTPQAHQVSAVPRLTITDTIKAYKDGSQ